MKCFKLSLIGLLAGGVARADFVPGHVYVADTALELCMNPDYPRDRVWDIDPQTGQVALFAEVPENLCGQLWGLAFTPDGNALRGSERLVSKIVEWDGDANIEVALSSTDGIAGPYGLNNILYDASGNFFVVNGAAHNILKFPAGGGSGSFFAGAADGVLGGGAIAAAPDGGLYYASTGNHNITVFSSAGQGGILATLEAAVLSLATNPAGDLFILATDGIHEFAGGDPSTDQLIVPNFLLGAPASMTLSPDGASLYVASNIFFREVDIQTGEVTLLATIPSVFGTAGAGIAVYVPEPRAGLLLAGLAALLAPPRARRRALSGLSPRVVR